MQRLTDYDFLIKMISGTISDSLMKEFNLQGQAGLNLSPLACPCRLNLMDFYPWKREAYMISIVLDRFGSICYLTSIVDREEKDQWKKELSYQLF